MIAKLIEVNSTFSRNYGSIKVAVPPIEFFLSKIRNMIHFQYLKMNHGFFDRAKSAANHKFGVARRPFDTIEHLAKAMYNTRSIWFEEVDEDIHYDATLAFLEDIRIRDIPNLFLAVSDSAGFGWKFIPSYRNGVGDLATYVQLRSCLNLNSTRPYLHGGLFRHYSIMGELSQLFSILNGPEYHSIIVGPSHCSQYKEKTSIDFSHLEIKYTNALSDIESIKQECKNLIKPDKHNIIFISLEIGCYPVARFLREENVTIIDIGRAFDYLIDSVEYPQPWLLSKYKESWEKSVNYIRNSNKEIDCSLL